MKTGFSALTEALADEAPGDVGELLKLTSITLIRVMGGASGVIFGTLFTSGLEQVRGKEALTAAELTDYLEAGYHGIVKRGRSCLGSKTMLDALYPAVEGMRSKLRETADVRRCSARGTRARSPGLKTPRAWYRSQDAAKISGSRAWASRTRAPYRYPSSSRA